MAAAAARKNIEIISARSSSSARPTWAATCSSWLTGSGGIPPSVTSAAGSASCAPSTWCKTRRPSEAWGTEHPFIKGLALRTQERGLITRVWDVLHLAPPLVVTEREVEQAVDIVDGCLTEMEREFADLIG